MLDVFKIPKLSHLSTKNKTALSLYPWKNCKPDFYNQLQKPLTECNVAIVSSAGLYDFHSQETYIFLIPPELYQNRLFLANDLSSIYLQNSC